MLRQLTGQRLATAVEESFTELGVGQNVRATIERLLAALQNHYGPTYEHCLRVGLSSRKIAQHLNHSAHAQTLLLFSGLLHDAGKALTPLEVLECKHDWTADFQHIIKRHVKDGYRMVVPHLPMAAAILLWHHRFQPDPYPEHFPASAKRYSVKTQARIKRYGRLLALADFYDAAHRKNERNGDARVTDAAIKERMLLQNEDERPLVAALYDAGIFLG